MQNIVEVLHYHKNENMIKSIYVKPSDTKIPTSIYHLLSDLRDSMNSNKFNKLYIVGVRYSFKHKHTKKVYLLDVQPGLTETSLSINEDNENALTRVLSEEIQIRSNNHKILLAETIKPTKKRKAQNWYIMKLKKNEYTHSTSFPPKTKSNKGVGLIIIGTINDLKNILFDFDSKHSTDNIAYPVLININQMLNERNYWFKDFVVNNPVNLTYNNIEKIVNIENRNNNNELLSETTNYALQGLRMNVENNRERIQKLQEQNNRNANNLLRNVTNTALKETRFDSMLNRLTTSRRRNII